MKHKELLEALLSMIVVSSNSESNGAVMAANNISKVVISKDEAKVCVYVNKDTKPLVDDYGDNPLGEPTAMIYHISTGTFEYTAYTDRSGDCIHTEEKIPAGWSLLNSKIENLLKSMASGDKTLRSKVTRGDS